MIRQLLFGAIAAACLMAGAPAVHGEVWQQKKSRDRLYYRERAAHRSVQRYYYYHTWANPVYYGTSGVYYYGLNPATIYENQNLVNPMIYSPGIYSPGIATGQGFVSGWLY